MEKASGEVSPGGGEGDHSPEMGDREEFHDRLELVIP